jgi:CRP-like cAMP-binding protein
MSVAQQQVQVSRLVPQRDIGTMLRMKYLFLSLSDEQMATVMRTMRVHRLGDGEVLFDMEQHADRFFYLHRGQIKLYRLSASSGQEKVMELVRPNEFFAVAVMFLEKPLYPVCAEALAVSTVYSFDSRLFMGILRSAPDTAFRMMAYMSKRLRSRVKEIDSLCLKKASARLIEYLMEQIDQGESVVGADSSVTVTLDVQKRTLAARLSIQPETFSRILKTLQTRSLIVVDQNRIQIPDVRELVRFAEVCD